MYATITDAKCNLEQYADAINRGRNDDFRFYVNGKTVSFSHSYGRTISDEEALSNLEWFLKGREYTITK
jgi:hypothetical protein